MEFVNRKAARIRAARIQPRLMARAVTGRSFAGRMGSCVLQGNRYSRMEMSSSIAMGRTAAVSPMHTPRTMCRKNNAPCGFPLLISVFTRRRNSQRQK